MGLGASVSPVAVLALISVMFGEKPEKNILAFLSGYTLSMVAIGVLGIFALQLKGGSVKGVLKPWLDIAFGALCLLAIPLATRKHKEGGYRAGGKSIQTGKAFALGLAAMLVNSSTIIIYLSGIHEISAAELKPWNDVFAVAVLTAVTLVTLVVPTLIYFLFPASSKKVLALLNSWLSRHSRVIGALVLLAVGTYLLVKGIVGLT